MESTTTTQSPSLDRLVSATEGFQPLRKLFHAMNAVLICAGLVLLDLSRTEASFVLGAIFAALLVGDLVRLKFDGLNALFFKTFRRLASPREAAGLASSTWYALGAFLAVVVAPLDIAISAILVLGLCDPVASYVGVHWGRRPFLGGTLEGTAAFLVVAALILGLRHSPAEALGVALAAALAERWSWPLDDNVTVPVVSALLLVLLGLW